MSGPSRRGYAFVVAALYALAMIMLGFAHQPQVRASVVPADVAALVLPDGSVPPICGQVSHDAPDNAGLVQHCDACALSSAPGLPPVAAVGAPVPVFRVVRLGLATPGQFSPGALPAPTSRGPPLS